MSKLESLSILKPIGNLNACNSLRRNVPHSANIGVSSKQNPQKISGSCESLSYSHQVPAPAGLKSLQITLMFSGYELEQLEFSLSPDFEYPTAKPYEMIKSLVKSFTKPKEWVFDPFVGSAKIVRACKELGRFCHVIDVSETSFNKFVFPNM